MKQHIETITQLLLGAAYADKRLAGAEITRIRALLITLIGGVAVMLVWAGLIEGLFSQYHEPALPYAVKIAFGLAELAILVVFLSWSGRSARPSKP